MPDDNSHIQKSILEITETLLEAQLGAVRKLRRQVSPELPSSKPGPKPKGRSQLDLVFDILSQAGEPLHIIEVIRLVKKAHGTDLDRESLVSALTKRVARNDRFMRPAPNTFALLPQERGASSRSAKTRKAESKQKKGRRK